MARQRERLDVIEHTFKQTWGFLLVSWCLGALIESPQTIVINEISQQ